MASVGVCSSTSLAKKKLDVGQCAIEQPCSIMSSASPGCRWTQCAMHEGWRSSPNSANAAASESNSGKSDEEKESSSHDSERWDWMKPGKGTMAMCDERTMAMYEIRARVPTASKSKRPSSSTQQHAAARSSTQQQAATRSSKQQQAAASSSTQQQAAARSSKQQQKRGNSNPPAAAPARGLWQGCGFATYCSEALDSQ